MPWSVRAVSEIRLAFVHEVVSLKRPLTEACRKYGISRKTGHKWLARYKADPAAPLRDRSRRPQRCPRRAAADLEQRVLAVRDQYGWGAGKIRDFLRNQAADDPRALAALPCERTVGNILRRHGRIADGPHEPKAPPQFFARSRPNALWQCDFKGPVEVARRQLHPFTVLDDHSRFLLALRPCPDVTMASAWAVLWDTFGEFGLPEELLCDNAFGTPYPALPTLSWFEARLIRLGIRPAHGRPYHPQTQGKVERLHGTLEAEVWPHVDRGTEAAFDRDVQRWRVEVYNPVRPHEALGGQPPLRFFRPSERPRPARLPAVSYPAGSVTRKVDKGGDISWSGYRILVGAGLTGEVVRVEERAAEVAVFYCWKQVRCLATTQLVKGKYL
jgi:Integrase core domain/Homeodomain-like domain